MRDEEKPDGPSAASWLETSSSADDFSVVENSDVVIGEDMMLPLVLLL